MRRMLLRFEWDLPFAAHYLTFEEFLDWEKEENLLEQLGDAKWRVGMGACLKVAPGHDCWLRLNVNLRRLLGSTVLGRISVCGFI